VGERIARPIYGSASMCADTYGPETPDRGVRTPGFEPGTCGAPAVPSDVVDLEMSRAAGR
jgi:hypothetical protein